MAHHTAALQQFKNEVGIKFQLYNSLFTSLPFHRIEKTGIMLSLFLMVCEEGYKQKRSPRQIIDDFFQRHTQLISTEERLDMLFRFTQYAERQVVLFDALEDAAFAEINDMKGPGTLKQIEALVQSSQLDHQLASVAENFAVRLVLTAHPTQFYPGTVLGIINDLSRAVIANNVNHINIYLQQLGKTPFFNKQKPSPYDEAVSLIWYLENVFYTAAGKVIHQLQQMMPHGAEASRMLQMGFWPGGDRDGNPFVEAATTKKVAEALRGAIVKCYYADVRKLKRRLTFKEVDTRITALEKQLYEHLFLDNQIQIKASDIIEQLNEMRNLLVYQHNSFFVPLVDDLINKVKLFGLYFASLDIRQESSVHAGIWQLIMESDRLHATDYASLQDDQKLERLASILPSKTPLHFEDAVAADCLQTIQLIKDIQLQNGEQACHRYIISQCNSAANVMEVFALFRYVGYEWENIKVDIVPLFETIEDLQHSESIMRSLYEMPLYRQHLMQRQHVQTIMLGFSDGTKDGGYLMANWSIYKAKEALTQLSETYGLKVVFFDGRGGPPARGGGKTHKFYASMGKEIANKEIQLTVQGQTVSSNFGTVDAARFNMEQLLHAGLYNNMFAGEKETLNAEEKQLLEQLSAKAYAAYLQLRDHPRFMDYLTGVSALRFYSDTNIGSRPSKRNSGSKMMLKDLRAIPFVGAWSQLKQNVTGYYGVGAALKAFEAEGKWKSIATLYEASLFFRTLMDNCEMAMHKCFFPLTQHLAAHEMYGEIWQMIYDEFNLTKQYISKLNGQQELMHQYPVEQLSVQMRERIILPLTTIQQYALEHLREMDEATVTPLLKPVMEKLVIRCSFGIINAGRNSA